LELKKSSYFIQKATTPVSKPENKVVKEKDVNEVLESNLAERCKTMEKMAELAISAGKRKKDSLIWK